MSPEKSSLPARLEALADQTLHEASLTHQSALQAHQAAQALHAHLVAHGQRLAADLDSHGQHLDQLQADAVDTEDHLQDLAESFHGSLAQLAAGVEAQEHALVDAVEGLHGTLESQLQQALLISSQLDDRLQNSLHRIDELRHQADTLLTEITEAGGLLHVSLAESEEHLDGLLGLLNQTVGETTSLLEQRLEVVEHLLTQTRMEVLDSGQRAFLEDGLRRLEGATGGLAHALDLLGAGAQEHRGHVEGGAGQLLSHMQGVIHMIDQVRPILDTIQSVLA